jgi:hypothetical protein
MEDLGGEDVRTEQGNTEGPKSGQMGEKHGNRQDNTMWNEDREKNKQDKEVKQRIQGQHPMQHARRGENLKSHILSVVYWRETQSLAPKSEHRH